MVWCNALQGIIAHWTAVLRIFFITLCFAILYAALLLYNNELCCKEDLTMARETMPTLRQTCKLVSHQDRGLIVHKYLFLQRWILGLTHAISSAVQLVWCRAVQGSAGQCRAVHYSVVKCSVFGSTSGAWCSLAKSKEEVPAMQICRFQCPKLHLLTKKKNLNGLIQGIQISFPTLRNIH